MYRLENVKYKDIIYIESLEILPQKITCILGESGGGKTTLIKLLNKMISPTSGDIFYKEKSLRKIDSVELRREVVMLSQSPGIFPGSVRDNLLIGLKFSEKDPADDSELVEIMKKVHLYKSLDDVAENLSGGEKQRVALGRVMLMDPKILLLDEPSSALDEKTEKNIIKEVTDYVKTKNKTLIMVTHSKEIARDHADEIIEMAQGRVIDKKVGDRNG
ncbi:ABC transporter ATP-binding protein [Ilyobacter polytropus]|uniref:ABC transporter related protein n=1 Tax=Ilyobacter polytropus (strain ATCC 51220 / DSM 2926 / LMG 16218 / CuHBu1) TaxID=572544 RepID=E3H679_ILYPC|nr:ABC transporter ATP-binding protein [Ilyobacter polytropus]ADO81838.1 ABC transporter related protein [Ilyobacter polytropus DSM 2926]